jgi:hypothetical protein
MLLAGGADMNACDVWGNTPLFYWPVLLGEPDDLAQEMVARLLTHVSAASCVLSVLLGLLLDSCARLKH